MAQEDRGIGVGLGIGLLAGAAIGIGLGLLFAPKEGAALRREGLTRARTPTRRRRRDESSRTFRSLYSSRAARAVAKR